MQAIDMESLNDEFKRTVADMKPFAKQLPQKSGNEIFLNNARHCCMHSKLHICYSDARHKVTLWIKKLLGVKHERYVCTVAEGYNKFVTAACSTYAIA